MFLIGQREYPQRGRMANVDRKKAQRANIQSLRSSRTNTPSLPASNETTQNCYHTLYQVASFVKRATIFFVRLKLKRDIWDWNKVLNSLNRLEHSS
jgi:hypothetical protein